MDRDNADVDADADADADVDVRGPATAAGDARACSQAGLIRMESCVIIICRKGVDVARMCSNSRASAMLKVLATGSYAIR